MSVYAKFLDKNKSKLCESKSKKVSLKKLKRVNESDAYEEELRYEKVADEHIGLNKLEYDDGSVQYLVYGTTFKDEYIDDKEEAEEFFNDMLDELLEKYGDIIVDKQGVTGFVLKDGTDILVNKLIRADDKFEFEVIIDYDNYPPIFSTEEEALEYVDDFLKEQGYTDAEIEELYEKGHLDESCGKRKPKKPFPRKSLKESAKDRFLKKAFSKSKLSESRTLKRTRKVRVSMNESYYAYKPMDTFFNFLSNARDDIDFCITNLKTMQKPISAEDKKEYENLSDKAKKGISEITRDDLEKAYNIIMDIMRKLP